MTKITTRRFALLVSCLLLMADNQSATAKASEVADPNISVGLTGCSSDVPVTASRTSISLTVDGREVPALFYEPQGIRAGSALVMLHGRDVASDLAVVDNHAIQLASRGFSVLTPFYLEARRDSDEASRARSAHQVWRAVAEGAAEALAAETGLEPEKVLLWGHTRGGGIALATALEENSRVGGAIGVNIGGSPQNDAQGRGRPFLLIHSDRSTLIPAREIRSMAEKIEDRGGSVERLEISAEYGQFQPGDWCRVFDGTRGLLERVSATSPRN